MTFENFHLLWFLVAIPPLLIGLGLWSWKATKETATLFKLDLRHLKKKYIERYALYGILIAIFIIVLATPMLAVSKQSFSEKTGEIIICVDVSASMSAQKSVNASTRLERAKLILYEIIDRMEELGGVKISVCGFTTLARSLVPLVEKEDYSYLRESIKTVLDIFSVPGTDTGFGQPILDVQNKFSEGEKAKLLIVISDGEYYTNNSLKEDREEWRLTELAVQKVLYEDIKLITVGVGESEGAKIHIYDSAGKFTGEYSQYWGEDFVSYLNEERLQKYASRTAGAYFYEDNVKELIDYIKDTLVSINTEEVIEGAKVYHSVANYFILGSIPLWILLVKRHILD